MRSENDLTPQLRFLVVSTERMLVVHRISFIGCVRWKLAQQLIEWMIDSNRCPVKSSESASSVTTMRHDSFSPLNVPHHIRIMPDNAVSLFQLLNPNPPRAGKSANCPPLQAPLTTLSAACRSFPPPVTCRYGGTPRQRGASRGPLWHFRDRRQPLGKTRWRC